jgi:hypothetical protein
MIRKQNIHKPITNNIQKNHFVKKGRNNTQNSGFQKEPTIGRGGGGGGRSHNKARTIFLLLYVLHDLHRDIVGGWPSFEII